jgi:hypothetical protein
MNGGWERRERTGTVRAEEDEDAVPRDVKCEVPDGGDKWLAAPFERPLEVTDGNGGVSRELRRGLCAIATPERVP